MYSIVNVGITDSQLQTLLAGQKIFLEKRQFSGNVPLPLTKKQANSIATASRGINLKMSSRQLAALQSGEGLMDYVKDGARALAPVARKGVNAGLDFMQGMLPTHKLGQFQGIADAAVGLGRNLTDKLVDRVQKMLGGAAGIRRIEAQLGQGWFKDYLLPGVKTAADIAIPLIRGGAARKDWHFAIDKQMGQGWFKDYLLPGIKTAADIAVPLIRGSGAQREAMLMDGEGWFSSFIGPAIKGVVSALGGGFVPMAQKKKGSSGRGLVL